MKAIAKFLRERLNEASTIRGGIYILTAIGIHFDATQTESIVSFGLALSGLIGTFVPDKTGVP